jgi:hypothetical protein
VATERKTSKSSTASSSKRRNSNAASASSRSRGQASTAARKRSGSSLGKAKPSGTSPRRQKPAPATPQRASARSEDDRGTIARGTVGALAGAAAVGVAARAALKHRSRGPKVLGVSIPRRLNAGKLDPRKLAQNADAKKLVKQIGDVAGAVEARSEDVRMLSAQVKRLSKKLS